MSATLGPDGWVVDPIIAPPVHGKIDPVTGDIALSGAGKSDVLAYQGLKPVAPRILKKFVDLANVTIAPSTLTVAASIDQNSLFGGPALKLVISPPSGGYLDLKLTNLNIPSFNGQVAASVWIDEPNRYSSLNIWECADTTPTNYTNWSSPFFSGGDCVGGHRVVWGGPMAVGATIGNGGTGFIAGTSPLKMAMLRISVLAGASTTLWVRDIFIPAKQRPVICFTFDDSDVSWMTRARAILNANNVKATFGIYSFGIDNGGANVTSADVQTLAADGHQISCHNVNNYRLQTLSSNGNGELNGTSLSLDATGYTAEYHTARQVLENLGVDPAGLMYHPWVQGGSDTQAAALLQGAGVELARTTSPYQAQPYGYRMGNDVMNLRAWPLASTKTLAQNKAAIDQAVTYGGLLIFMGHVLADTSTDTVTYSESEFAELVAYAVDSGADILTMRQLRDRLAAMGALDGPSTNPSPPVRMIGRLLLANFNTTADQTITLPSGSWIITQVYVTKGTISMTTAAGGVYTTTAKGGTAIVAAAQAYTGLTGTATDVVTTTPAATPTVSSSIYLSLTAPQGSAATADVFVFGRPA